MKIAHVVATLPPRPGGMGMVAWHEAMGLVKNGHDVTIFTLRYHGQAAQEIVAGVTIRRLRGLPRWGDAGLVPQLFWLLRSFDLVHLHYPWYGAEKPFWSAALIFKIKYVVTYHMDAAPIGLFKRAVQVISDTLWARLLLTRAKAVFTVSQEHFAGSRFRPLIAPERIVTLPPGVNNELFKPGSVNWAVAGIAPIDQPVILFVGNPIPLKRLDFLLHAFALLENTQTVLVIVGGGYQLSQYQKLAIQLGIAGRVKFVGAVTDPGRLAQLYRLATCVAVPSLTESFSLVVSEALSTGCPVVAMDLPVYHGRVEQGVTGWLVEPSASATQFAAALEDALMLSLPERQQYATRAQEKIRNFSWERHLEVLEQTYKTF